MNITYKSNNSVKAADLIEVFDSVGWNKEEENIIEAFNNSYYITAYHQDTLIGFARAISDGHYYTGIYDLIVLPEYQGNGIGRQMMDMLVDKFEGTYIFLTYTEGNRDFYKKCGFEDIDNSMWIPRNS